MITHNPNTRLETFCDGVFAIAMTLLVIDIKIPHTALIRNTTDFWLAIQEILPSIFAFILSFIIIFITWVNHHNILKLVNNTSPAFIYANGFLLLTVVFIPFPTSMLGEFILTDHASPAVLLYCAMIAVQSMAWIIISHSVLKNELAKSEKAIMLMQENKRNGLITLIVYSTLSIVSAWFPLTVAMLTTLTSIFWLIYGIKIKHD